MLGGAEGFIIAAIFYAISLFIVFSPLGEKLIRAIERVRKIETQQEKEYLLPLFDEVYKQAKQRNPELGKIELCIIDKMTVNACAIGKSTVAVTKEAIDTFSADELKSIIAHEIAHILYGDTIASLYTTVGNGLFAFFVIILRTFLAVFDFVQALYNRPGSERLFIIVIRFIVDCMIFSLMFLMKVAISIGSRKNEFRADRYAFELGYGQKLKETLYILEKLKLGDGTVIQAMTASHPRITARIEQLENMLERKPMQGNPWALN